MRKFNPEKELKKIQRGNKNKIIISVIVLLLIIAIGSSYALYQIRYNKQIIYTTVAPFNKKDIILSVKLDDQEKSTDKFPDKGEGYVYSHIECENDNIQNANWNEDTWKLNAEINGPDKCTVFFVKSPFHMKSCENKSISECLLEEGQKFINILAFDDPDQNGRYYGKDPANYIWFNCDSYENLTNATAEDEDHNCERWRIIGSFKDITIVDDKVNTDTPTKENLVKIIRSESIGDIEWDKSGGPHGLSDWTKADLQNILNGVGENEYLNPLDNGNWIKYNKDINYKSITNKTKEMIKNIRWNIGGYSTVVDVIASQWYSYERGTIIPKDAQTVWDGQIALFYPSDYGYATAGNNNGKDRTVCLATKLNEYDTDCINNNWLYISGKNQWTLTPQTAWTDLVIYVSASGKFGNNNAYYVYTVRPALYLTHDTEVTSGDGTYDNPYLINVN